VTDDGLRRHLLEAGLAGDVATSPGSTVDNCGKLVAGEERYTFGLSDWRDATFIEALNAVRSVCGGDPGAADRQGTGCIDVDATLRGIAAHREALAALGRSGGARVLLATGHPTGLLPHYGAVARWLQARGSLLLCPLDDRVLHEDERGRGRGVRFLDGVAVVWSGGELLHTHRSRYMEAMLDAVGPVDLVIGDHGMAGAAIERGLPTLSIADVNDAALFLAQARGRTSDVLAIDDNLAPRLFVPVTQAMLP
jgi:hypothetical protein